MTTNLYGDSPEKVVEHFRIEHPEVADFVERWIYAPEVERPVTALESDAPSNITPLPTGREARARERAAEAAFRLDFDTEINMRGGFSP